jgi:NADH:ubiquinone reductase (H+-translocating)
MAERAHTPHVVILGGGFGGLAAARALGKAPVRVTLIDRRNHHLFQPLLYQVATAALNPGDIAYPIRGVLKEQANVRVLLAEATGVDPARQQVVIDGGLVEYDYLVVATGATHSYFGHDEWAEHAPGLKSIDDALEIRRRVFLAYEAAEREADVAEQRAWLTFVVVGAGPTGVELAGALGEIGLHTLARDFRRIDPTGVRVVLLEGKDRVLPPYPPKLSAAAQRSLEKRRVSVRTGCTVVAVDDAGVTFEVAGGGREQIAARTVLWAAGVQGSPIARSLGAPLDRAGRVEVLPDLSIPGHPEIFVVGDLAHGEQDGQAWPGVAQHALQGGRHVGRLIAAEARGRTGPRPAYRYRDKGSMATIGRAAAVVATRRVAISGFFAWLMWWVVHVFYLVGFKNRFFVMLQWAWQWLTFQRGARLITGELGALPPVRDLRADGTIAAPRAAEVVALADEELSS